SKSGRISAVFVYSRPKGRVVGTDGPGELRDAIERIVRVSRPVLRVPPVKRRSSRGETTQRVISDVNGGIRCRTGGKRLMPHLVWPVEGINLNVRLLNRVRASVAVVAKDDVSEKTSCVGWLA